MPLGDASDADEAGVLRDARVRLMLGMSSRVKIGDRVRAGERRKRGQSNPVTIGRRTAGEGPRYNKKVKGMDDAQ